MSDHIFLVHLPAPFGWLALTSAELGRAQARAQELAPNVADDGRASPLPEAPAARLLSADAAAELLGVDASWLARAAREGAIPCVRLGKYVRFDPAAVVAHCTKAERSRP